MYSAAPVSPSRFACPHATRLSIDDARHASHLSSPHPCIAPTMSGPIHLSSDFVLAICYACQTRLVLQASLMQRMSAPSPARFPPFLPALFSALYLSLAHHAHPLAPRTHASQHRPIGAVALCCGHTFWPKAMACARFNVRSACVHEEWLGPRVRFGAWFLAHTRPLKLRRNSAEFLAWPPSSSACRERGAARERKREREEREGEL
eukprot:1007698-Rhodomonas_salina.1